MKLVLNDAESVASGSTRIWIHNLCGWLCSLGYDARVNDWDNYENYDAVIFGKNTKIEAVQFALSRNPNIKIGWVNPCYKKMISLEYGRVNFFIVGSIEEKDSMMSSGKKVFIFPLIENIVRPPRIHVESKRIILGYHGNLQHLNNISDDLAHALTRLSAQYDIVLKVVYDIQKLGKWTVRRPHNVNIIDVQWHIDTWLDELSVCDIGLVPSLAHMGQIECSIMHYLGGVSSHADGKHQNDYVTRYKNKTNAGRAFVFHQLGIPVIADFAPSNFHILADPSCGYLANTSAGWHAALLELATSPARRTKIAAKAKAEFNRLYNPLDWAESLYQDINAL